MIIDIPTNIHRVDLNNYVILDDNSSKTVKARIKGFPVPVLLWKGADYDAAGEYTQAQTSSRLNEVLGNDPAATLTALLGDFPI